MKAFSFIFSAVGLLMVCLVSPNALAADLCEAETQPLFKRVKAFKGTEAEKKQIISEYHHRRQFVYEACKDDKIQEFEKSFASVMSREFSSARKSLGFEYKVRKPVEIGEIPSRIPASRIY
jgi:hypothetical protein